MTTSRNLGLAAAFAALALLYALPAIAARAIVQDLFGILTLLVFYVAARVKGADTPTGPARDA